MAQEKTIQRKKKPSEVKVKESELAKILAKDKQLGEDKPRLQLFLTLANFFDMNLKDNLTLNSFELDDKYFTSNVNAWAEFKQYPPVRKYITKFLEEQQYSEAMKTIITEGIAKTKDALNVQSIIEGKQKADENMNIIVFLMPQKNYTKVE